MSFLHEMSKNYVLCYCNECVFTVIMHAGFVTHSSSTSDENGNYAFNAMAKYSCNTGFVLVGDNIYSTIRARIYKEKIHPWHMCIIYMYRYYKPGIDVYTLAYNRVDV